MRGRQVEGIQTLLKFGLGLCLCLCLCLSFCLRQIRHELFFADAQRVAGDTNNHSARFAGVRSNDPAWVNVRVRVQMGVKMRLSVTVSVQMGVRVRVRARARATVRVRIGVRIALASFKRPAD